MGINFIYKKNIELKKFFKFFNKFNILIILILFFNDNLFTRFFNIIDIYSFYIF